MRKIFPLLLLSVLSMNLVFANYTGTYGKVDNLEIGFDMGLDFFIQLAPYVLYIILALFVAWGINKLISW